MSNDSLIHGRDIFCGELAGLSGNEFAERFLGMRKPGKAVRAADFLQGRTHSEAIEAALAAEPVPGIVVLDSQDWLINRAILLPSDTELVIDGCKLKLSDGVHDNIIRSAGIMPDPSNPNGKCISVEPVENIRISGHNGAVLEGADKPYIAANPKTGEAEPWLGDYFGWRTVGIQLSQVSRYEISGFTMRKTHCWAISQEFCSLGLLHDIVFDTDVKNGDGINFRNGCSFCMVENIFGTVSDDMVACTALNGSYITPESAYVYPMQPMGSDFTGDPASIHDIVIRNLRFAHQCVRRGKWRGASRDVICGHAVICLATSPEVYNILIENIEQQFNLEQKLNPCPCVEIYTGYGTGYRSGNLRNIRISGVVSCEASCAVKIRAAVKDVMIAGVKQLNSGGVSHLLEGDSENLVIVDATI